jgi:hypothetical protein
MDEPERFCISSPCHNVICSGIPTGVVRAKGRVDSTNHYGDFWEMLPDELDGLEEAGIPVRHSRSHCDDIGLFQCAKLLDKGCLGDSVLTIVSGDRFEGSGFFDFDL